MALTEEGTMLNRFAALFAACAVALGLAACGGDDESGGGEGISANAGENAKGNVTWCIGKDTTGAFNQVVKDHNKANPDVKVKLIELPTSADEQRTQLIQRLRAKSAECDVLGMDVIWTAEFAAQKWLRDVSDVVEQRKGDFIASTLESAKYEDAYWAIPFNTNAGFIYYRTDKIKSAPKTWQDVDQMAKSGGGLVYQGAQYEGLTVNFLERLYSAGGKALSDDGKQSELNSPEAEKVLAQMAEEVKSGTVPKANSTYMEEESRRAFESGKAAAMRNWPYAYALGKKSDVGSKFAVAPLPAFEGGEPAGVLGGYNLGISAYSKNPEAAVEFVNYATNMDSQVLMGSKASLPPVLTGAYDDPKLKKAMPFAEELRTGVEQAQPRPVSPVYTQISEAIYKNVYTAIQGKEDPKAALEKASSAVDKALQTF
jgi:multiple sugar transport system substrate-binding protein